MISPPPTEPVITRARRLSAVYLPPFCAGPAEIQNAAITVTVASETAPMVRVAPHGPEAIDSRDRVILVTHGAAIRVPASDGETCDPYVFHMVQAIRCGYRRHLEPPRKYLESLAEPLLKHLERHYAGRTRERERGGLSDARLERTLAFIERHYAGNVSIEDLAEAACLSPFHFCHMFKRSTGLSPQAFVRRRRIQAAADLLGSTSTPIAEIAHRTGHENQAHFSVAFRRVMGMTPSRYRRQARRRMESR